MSNIVFEALQAASRPKRRSGNNIQFNCPACVYQNAGHRPDSKWRGGATIMEGSRFVYHCHNCQFKTGWTPGGLFSPKVENLLSWCGISDDVIRDIKFYAYELRYRALNGGPRVDLPSGLQSCEEWVDKDCTDERFLKIATFLQSFDPPHDLKDYFWTPDPNAMALDTYVVSITGTYAYPTRWAAFPLLDPSQPHRTHEGVEPEPDDTIPPHILAEMDRLWAETARGEDGEIEEKP